MNPTKLIRSIFAKRLSQIDRYADYGDIIQQKTLLDLLQKAKNTEFGTKFKFNDISSYKSFAENIPINGYEELKPYIERTMSGEQNILWPTPIRHFAKSSGTTNDKSKFIPVSAESLRYCHYQGGSDCVALYLRENPQSRFFSGKGLILGGSRAQNPFGKAYCGDLSAILIQNINPLINLIRVPSKKIALMSEWDTKLEAIAESTIDRDITNLSGVPSWFLVLIKHILKKTGRQNLTEQHFDKGRLTSAARSYNKDEFAWFNMNIDVLQGNRPTGIYLAYISHFQHYLQSPLNLINQRLPLHLKKLSLSMYPKVHEQHWQRPAPCAQTQLPAQPAVFPQLLR